MKDVYQNQMCKLDDEQLQANVGTSGELGAAPRFASQSDAHTVNASFVASRGKGILFPTGRAETRRQLDVLRKLTTKQTNS